MSSRDERTGVLGGTFDPIHVGHLAAARAAMECAQLDRIIFVPTGRPPHRPPTATEPGHRLEMTRLATSTDKHFEVSDVEVKRPGRSFTSDTLRELHAQHPADQLFLILGWDAARLFKTWHEPDQVRQLATITVVARPGSRSPQQSELDAAGLDGKGVFNEAFTQTHPEEARPVFFYVRVNWRNDLERLVIPAEMVAGWRRTLRLEASAHE